jgi:hypothetical protein
MSTNETLLTPGQLADRWHCSVKKLDADRLRGTGCPYVKIGRLVRYRATDIEAHEAAQLRHSTSDEHSRS